jgi:hypothetical protein
MKIKKTGSLLVIDSAKGKAGFPLSDKLKGLDDMDIVLMEKPDKTLKAAVVIDTPGEYEANDIFVYALSKHIDNVDLFSLDIEGMNIIIFNSGDEITDLIDSENISKNNILICNIGSEFTKLTEIVDELEPNVLILTGEDDEKIQEAIKKLSLNPIDTQTNYSFNEDLFSSEEEKPMQILLLK